MSEKSQVEELMPPAVQAAAEHLMLTAREHGITVAGFLFSADPICFMNFGTCNDAADLRLYEVLCKMFDAKQEQGKVQRVSVARKQ